MRRLFLDVDVVSVLRVDADWLDSDQCSSLPTLPREKEEVWSAYQAALAEYHKAFDRLQEALEAPVPLTSEEIAERNREIAERDRLDQKFNT